MKKDLMPKIYKILFLVVVAVTAKTNSSAQVVTNDSGNIRSSKIISDTIVPHQKQADSLVMDTVPVSVNVELENIFNAKSPKQYVISDIKVTGTKSFDPNLIISVSYTH